MSSRQSLIAFGFVTAVTSIIAISSYLVFNKRKVKSPSKNLTIEIPVSSADYGDVISENDDATYENNDAMLDNDKEDVLTNKGDKLTRLELKGAKTDNVMITNDGNGSLSVWATSPIECIIKDQTLQIISGYDNAKEYGISHLSSRKWKIITLACFDEIVRTGFRRVGLTDELCSVGHTYKSTKESILSGHDGLIPIV